MAQILMKLKDLGVTVKGGPNDIFLSIRDKMKEVNCVLVWSQNECNNLEGKQNEMGRWLWDVVKVKNELRRGETGWSTFEERERRKGDGKLVAANCV